MKLNHKILKKGTRVMTSDYKTALDKKKTYNDTSGMGGWNGVKVCLAL